MQPSLPQEYIQWIDDLVQKINPELTPSYTKKTIGIWAELKRCEDNLISRRIDLSEVQSGTEFGLTLFVMNELILPSNMQVFRRIGMPSSSISMEMWQDGSVSFISEIQQGSGLKANDGTLWLDIPFGQLDPGWAVSGICYILKELGIIKTHKFNTTPAAIKMPDKESLQIAVIGDWGTGSWRDGKYKPPSALIGEAVKNLNPLPDIIIHLGDVYYSGLRFEEARNFIRNFPVVPDCLNLTLNSNHEAYSGSQGYYRTALGSTLFKSQQRTSYFSVSFKDWIIIGLDSAFFDKSFMCQDGALFDRHSLQEQFIKSLQINADQKILLFTHHHGMDYRGKKINQPLVDQLFNVLGKIYPDYWYYGHLHNGIVYNEKSAIGDRAFKTRSNCAPRLRCAGHGAIPYGEADLTGSSEIDYFAHTPIPNPNWKQKKRVLNGFATILLTQGVLEEKFYEVSPVSGVKCVWSN